MLYYIQPKDSDKVCGRCVTPLLVTPLLTLITECHNSHKYNQSLLCYILPSQRISNIIAGYFIFRNAVQSVICWNSKDSFPKLKNVVLIAKTNVWLYKQQHEGFKRIWEKSTISPERWKLATRPDWVLSYTDIFRVPISAPYM